MGLSRLDNFLKNTKGEILYVDPNSLDSTDSVDNQGNSLARPFKTIQRALIEAARFSYQRGLDNDRFGRTTILLYPGDHIVDNRPGWIPTNTANLYRLRSSATSGDLSPFDATTNFDLTTENNILYKLNSIYGGVIIPRGTSIVGLDLRKTKVRPKYVPNPENDQIERSAIFRVTGSCYLWQFTVLDAEPNGLVYKDYTSNTFVPNFSHHKLTAFEYADGVNNVNIDDDFISGADGEFTKTDLDMYYQKIGAVYGTLSGRAIFPETVGTPLDIQTKIDEYRIVGSTGAEVGISSIRAGDGVTSSTSITVTLSSAFTELDVDTPIRIAGVDSPGYDGQYVVNEVLSSTSIKYITSNAPSNPLPSAAALASATLNINVDTVTSASPYIFNVSLRSVFGMCGLHADGSKAGGFKSMVVAQFTGIGLQKDNNAFVKYNETTGLYEDRLAAGNANISTNSRARFKPTWENYHIKASNNSFIQNVSIFAIGFANHFIVESGGDMSITNSNSNFGARALYASGFRNDSFTKDDQGYLTHIIPPREIESTEVSVEFDAIDVGVTTSASAGAATTSRLYLYNQTNRDNPPDHVIDGYRIGTKENDRLNVLISTSGISTVHTSRIVIPNTTVSSENSSTVFRSSVGINSIASNVINLNSAHSFTNGEKIRVLSDNGHIPDGLVHNTIYYCITEDSTTPLTSNQIKIAQSYNDAINNNPITINSKGGRLTVVSRVSDKKPGDIGHPIQYDTSRSQWYINVSAASTENLIYNKILTTNVAATPRTYITRKPDSRTLSDIIYKARFVIPKDATNARPPLDGYILQESNTSTSTSNSEIQKYFSSSSASLTSSTEFRNFKFIADASWSSGSSTIRTEIPHNLKVGNQVEIVNIKSTNNTSGTANLGFNGKFIVTSVPSAKEFVVSLSTNPGTFTSDTTTRTTALPYFKRKKFNGTYIVYRAQEIQKYVAGKQDGIYHLILINSSNKPIVTPFTDLRLSQPIQNLYPQADRDNPKSDPKASTSFALSDPIGQVVLNDPRNSATKETLDSIIVDTNIGIGITDIVSNSVGTSHTIYTSIDHGFNRATKLSITSSGSGYGSGGAQRIYNARLVGVNPLTTGANATAVINVNVTGQITAAEIMDGGSAYQVGDQVNVVGVATTTGFSLATLTVSQIYNNVGDVISLDGVKGTTNTDYNNLYRITSVGINKTKEITVSSASTVGNATTTGVGATNTASTNLVLTGKVLNVSSLTYTNTTGIATVSLTERHGLFADNKVRIGGANSSLFNGDFVIKSVGTTTSFTINVGISTLSPSTSGTIFVYRHGFTSYGGATSFEDENVTGRFASVYAGITTTLLGPVTGPTITTVEIDTTALDLRIGDYIQVEEEIMRVKNTVTSNTITVFRGVLGSPRSSYSLGTVVRRVKILPVELRRNSIIRASGHTFEYIGFGPGNYSTALPDRQDRKLSPIEELTSQSFKENGGINVFTGMNSDGDFYIGNKKVSSATGQEEVFDAPVPTTVGEDLGEGSLNVGFDVLTPLEATISRSIRVEGGEDGRIISRFDGPVVFNNKITSNSTKGIEANSIFIQGESTTSRKYTVGISTPTTAGNPGDVVYNANPTSGGTLGWVYVVNNRWEPFGHIGTNGVL